MISRLSSSARVRQVFLIVCGGLAIGVAAFALSSQVPTYSYIGPIGRLETLREPGFDLWTGQPHGATYRVRDCPLGDAVATATAIGDCQTHEVTDRTAPDDLSRRSAIPLPIGTAAGAVIMLAVVAAARFLERWPSTRP